MQHYWPAMANWISFVHNGLTEMYQKHPFIAYGTDWLAFAHLVIAVAFWGPIKDTVKNIWGVEFGMIACVMVIPLAMICGPIRGILLSGGCSTAPSDAHSAACAAQRLPGNRGGMSLRGR